jgi:hypothetical protein
MRHRKFEFKFIGCYADRCEAIDATGLSESRILTVFLLSPQ